MVLKAPDHDGREQRQRLAVGFRHQERDDRHFAHVIGQLAHHRFEREVGRLHVDEIELHGARRNLAALERQRMRIIAQDRAQGGRGFSVHGVDSANLETVRSLAG
jgi:hypothetical protein